MTGPAAMTPQERELLAGEYVLGTLDPVRRAEVQRLLAQDPALAALVSAWEARLLPLAGLAEPVPPAPQLWSRIESTLGLGTRAVPAAARAPAPTWWQRQWASVGFWRGLSATALAAAVLLAVALVRQPTAQPPQFIVVLVAPQDKSPGWVVQAASSREVSLIPLGTLQVPPGKALEFWTKADDWQAPVSLGLVRPGQRVRVPLERLPALQPNQLFEMTLEPDTGSPTGRPTGPIQFIGRAVPTS